MNQGERDVFRITEEIDEILGQLLVLQNAQTDLLGRLAELNVRENQRLAQRIERRTQRQEQEERNFDNEQAELEGRPRVPTPEREPRAFEIGDCVVIKNPKPDQPNKGVIVKKEDPFFVVRTSNGSIVKRAPHNLRFEKLR